MPAPAGPVVVGTGYGSFAPVPDRYPLEYGSQEGFMFVFRIGVEMPGFQPGDPLDLTDPTNPMTKLNVFFDDTDIPLTRPDGCGLPVGYRESAPGIFEMEYPWQLMFELCWRSDNLIGKAFRVEVQVMDALGHYGSATRLITGIEPVDGYTIDTGSPGCTN